MRNTKKHFPPLAIVFILEILIQENETCEEVKKRWKSSQCPSSMQGECYSYGLQKIEIMTSSSTTVVNCSNELPDLPILRCLPNAKMTSSLFMNDCTFYQFSMKDLLINTSISKIYLDYTISNHTSNISLTISDLSKLRKITIRGIRTNTSEKFGLQFHSLPNLLKLNISDFDFTNFNNISLNNLSSLQELFIKNGDIQSIPEMFFTALSNLRILDLQFNKLTTIKEKTFTGLTDLRELYLSNNLIDSIERKAFSHLKNLHTIDLSFNSITTLSSSMPFGSSKYLAIVRVTNCVLRELPEVNWLHYSVKLLDFSNNLIQKVNLTVFTPNKAEVILTSNHIKTINIYFKELNSSSVSPSYYIKDNQLGCGCEQEKFLQFLHSDIQKLHNVFADVAREKCYSNSTLITEAWPNNLSCPITDCPLNCSCSRNAKGYIDIDCKGRHLLYPPSVIPFGTTTVYLQNNDISSLLNIDAYTWQKVTELYLSDNLLESLEDWMLISTSSIVNVLAVDNNHLTDIPLSLRNKISFTSNNTIYLANNCWSCGCTTVEFLKWFINSNHKIIDSNQTFCIMEDGHKELLLLVQVDQLCKKYWSAQIVAIVMFVVTLAILTLMIASYYQQKNIYPLLYYLRLKLCCSKKKMHCDKKYDIFMAYHEADRNYASVIIHKLQLYDQICTYKYLFAVDQNAEQSVQFFFDNSRKTLFLVSSSLVECAKFKEDFYETYQNETVDVRHQFLILVIGNIYEIFNLDYHFHIFFLTKTVLKWNEVLFWKKLRYYLRPTSKQS